MIYKNFQLLIAILFAVGIIITPWLIGGNLPFVRTIGLLACFVLLLTVFFSGRLVGTPTKLGLIVKILLLAGIAWGAGQMLSINGAAITEYLPATRRRLCTLVLAVSVFFVAAHVFRSQRMLPWVLAAFAINGVLITFFGLAQTISETDKLYWAVELIHGGQSFGPFVNGNNAGGYLIMCFAAANFFLARQLYRRSGNHKSRSNQSSHFSKKSSKPRLNDALVRIGRRFADAEPQLLYIAAGIAFTAAGVAASLSRGAMVALTVATFVGWGLLFRRNAAFGALSVLIVTLGVGVILWTQQSEAITTNIESLTKLQDAAPNRLAHWEDSLAYGYAYLPFGSGLGTYNFSYQPFQETTFHRWFKYAENQYLETLGELGIPGLALLLGVIITGLLGCLSLLNKPDSTSRAVGLTGLVCLVGQSIAAVFDFGWFIPSNMFLFAAMMGIVFGQLNWSWSASRVSQQINPWKMVWTNRLMALSLTVLSAWSAYEYSAVDARDACRRFYERFDPAIESSSVPDYQQLAEYAVSVRPDDARAHYQLALNHILQYRLSASEQMVTEVLQSQQDFLDSFKLENPALEPPEQPEFDFEDAWQRSTLLSLHSVAWSANRTDPAILKQIRTTGPVDQHLKPAWDELRLAAGCLDKFWFVDIGIAQLSLLMGEPDLENAAIDDAITKSLYNSRVLYLGGVLHQQSGNLDPAYQAWNRCLQQTREFDEPIIQACRAGASIKDFFGKVLPTEPNFRIWVARKYFGSDADTLLQRLLLRDTRLNLPNHELPEAERSFTLGEIEALSGNYATAIAHYREALKQENQVKWRIQLARSLIAIESFEQAITELKVCELYHGKHQLTCQRLLRSAKKLRFNKLRSVWKSE